MTQYPRRTKRKEQIRQQLILAAATLFSRKGYRHTTLADVADEAAVHVQTLYRHFKNKEELTAAAAAVLLNDFRSHFQSAPNDQSTFQTWRAWIERTVTFLASLGFDEHKKEQLLSPSSLMNDNFLLIIYSGYEDLLTEYLARDFRMDPKHSRLPRLAACTLWSGNEAAIKRCAGLDGGPDTIADNNSLLEESLGVVDDAEALFASYVKLPRAEMVGANEPDPST